jgi:threonine aldolase
VRIVNNDHARESAGWQFASDNTAGICPEAWEAMSAANQGYVASYGADRYTERACELIRSMFDAPAAEVFFVFNGTASNSLSLAHLVRSYHAIVCHTSAHVQSDECGAPEFFAGGAKLRPVEGDAAKISPAALQQLLATGDDLHAPKPRAVTLSQTTEWGTVYRPAEIQALSALAHSRGLLVHMDGARFANALAAVDVKAADLTWASGVDVLSLGGTKNGLNTTEAVVFFQQSLAQEFEYRCKQAGQLASKMRFQTSQWQGVLEDGAWLRHAAHANRMARQLGAAVSAVPGVTLMRSVEANAVFVDLPAGLAQALAAAGWHIHFMEGAGHRLMCSWATRAADIDALLSDLRRLG